LIYVAGKRMLLKQQLRQRQVQKLMLAPALQQAIKLLPLTNLDLIEVINNELSQNPMLEIDEESIEKQGEEVGQKDKTEVNKEQEKLKEDSGIKEDINTSQLGDERGFEAYFQEYFDNDLRSYVTEKKETPALENFVSKSASLWDHLNWQANLTFFDEKDREIAEYIIGNINEDGYLCSSVEEIAKTINTSVEKINKIRDKIRIFDPVGIGSLTLKEVLLTQMEYSGIGDEKTRKIVEDYLSLLEKSNFLKLAKELEISLLELKSHIEIIRSLEPIPGRKFSQEKTFYVVPDIIVEKEGDKLKIKLNDDSLPHLRINSYYKKFLAQSEKDNIEARQFLKDNMKKAFWFLRSLDQRNRTIYKVADYIVKKQKDFIEKGIEYIKPLTLIELAQEIGVHESTVGRVVANKYIMTPRGIFPLKYFFHKSLQGVFGEEVSSLRVKEKIKKLVENEDKKSPLSDIEIMDLLARANFKIARRTVSKYRKKLNIQPSHIRKRNYWMEGS